MAVQKAETGDLDRIEALLEANGLPHRDVRAKPECFFVARSGGEVVGAGGVEIRGSDGLLRSVVVGESARGQGYGTALCNALETYARENGVETLYLLTTTAADFFRRRGYEEVARESAPASIRETTEFADLCPATATCMKTDLR